MRQKIVEEMAAKSDFAFGTMEGEQDHIPCLVKSDPRMRTTCHGMEGEPRLDHSALMSR